MKSPASYSWNDYKDSKKKFSMKINKVIIANLLLETFRYDSKVYIYGIEKTTKELIVNVRENLGFSIKQIAKEVSMSERSVYGYYEGIKPVSLKTLSKLLHLSNAELSQTGLCKKEFWLIGCDSGNRNKICKLPLIIDSRLIYLIGYLFGDGCLHLNKWTLLFVDEYKEQMIKLQQIITTLFSVNSRIIQGDGKKWDLVIYSKAVMLFFNKLFEMPFGLKKNKLHVPSILVSLPNELKLSFLSGLFDADAGTLRIEEYDSIPKWFRNSPNIEFVQSSGEFVDEIKDLCLEQGIVVTGPYFNKANGGHRLFISGKTRLRYCNSINLFNHSIKKKRLLTICNSL